MSIQRHPPSQCLLQHALLGPVDQERAQLDVQQLNIYTNTLLLFSTPQHALLGPVDQERAQLDVQHHRNPPETSTKWLYLLLCSTSCWDLWIKNGLNWMSSTTEIVNQWIADIEAQAGMPIEQVRLPTFPY
jgi:hypothetical protein